MAARPTIAEMYDEHVYDVHAFFGYSRLSREDAEDLTQATFERALKALHRFDPTRASAKTWLLTIARNLLIDHHRRGARRNHVPISEELEPRAEASFAAGDAHHRLSIELAAALDLLSRREREVIALRFGAELTGPEIAALLDLSLPNVQQIASRALRKLRSELEPRREGTVVEADSLRA